MEEQKDKKPSKDDELKALREQLEALRSMVEQKSAESGNTEAKTQAGTQAVTQAVTPVDPELEKTVRIKLFYDGDRYKDPVFVGINGKNFLVQRNKWVEVPRYVANVIAQSEDQDARTNMMCAEMEAEYEASREAHRI